MTRLTAPWGRRPGPGHARRPARGYGVLPGPRAWGRPRDAAVAGPRRPGDDGGRRRAERPRSTGRGGRPQGSSPADGDADTRPHLDRRRLSPGSTPPMTTNMKTDGGVIPRSSTPRPPVDRGPGALRSGLAAAWRPRTREGPSAPDGAIGAPGPGHLAVAAMTLLAGARCALWVGRGSMAPASPPPPAARAVDRTGPFRVESPHASFHLPAPWESS